MTLIQRIIADPINTLKTLNNTEIVKVLEEADETFFNTNETLLSDDIYDIVKNYLRKKDPKNPYLKKVGAEITFNKEKLPYYLGSLDKIKDNEVEIIKWKTKYIGTYVISEKLDGISCLLLYDKGNITLWTRGDGYEGQNITHILPYLNIDTSSWGKQKIAIRGELIISRENWNKMTDAGANARNVVAGVIHSKSLNVPVLSKVDFIGYDMLFPRKKISDSFEIIKTLNFPLVKYIQASQSDLTLDMLSNTLQNWRKNSAYEIDGIVVYHNDEHKHTTGKNPKYAFAFKTLLTHEQAEVIVEDVEWNTSKHRYLKPLVKFNEITLAGVKIKQATGFNAAYIEKHKIGPGSHVIIIRSGDVIPHILNVLTPASNGNAKMPDVPYIWNDTRIDIMLSGSEKNREQDIQAFTHFMKTLDVDGVKEGVITKLYDAGFDTLQKIIHISPGDLQRIEGFKEKSATKVIEALQGISSVSCDKLMTASNVFGRGFGEKRLKLIIDEYQYIPQNKEKALKLTVEDITKIKGMATISAQQFIEHLPDFYAFYEELGIKCKKTVSITTSPKSPKLAVFKDKKVVFSGFRNNEYEQIIQANGGKITTSISKTTDYLFVKDKGETSSKIEKARDLGITIMSKEELEKLIE
jgi:NAD-dependent DNA ligase